MGRKLWQAGFLGSGVVGEDRVLARGAGGAAGVGVTLVQRHRQLQILLKLQTGVNFDLGSVGPVQRNQLTWLDVMARQRSRSSTSCLKVGL